MAVGGNQGLVPDVDEGVIQGAKLTKKQENRKDECGSKGQATFFRSAQGACRVVQLSGTFVGEGGLDAEEVGSGGCVSHCRRIVESVDIGRVEVMEAGGASRFGGGW